jgi:N-acetylneuraminic acid mutarotase
MNALGVFVLSLALAASAAAGAWSPSERLEIARAGLAAATAGDLVYVGGGAAAGDPANAFDVFDGNKESWRPLPALPKGLTNFAMAASDRFVFIAGGFAADAPGEPRKDIWAYDIESASWSRKSPMPHARAGHAMVALGGLVYVVGGSGPSAERTLVYNPETDKWIIGAVLGVPRRALAAATDGKRIYAVGGIKGDGGVSNAFEMFDPASGVWAAQPPLPGARGALTAGIIGRRLHVAGGATWTPLKTYHNHDVFDLGSKSWSKGPALPTARQALASGVSGGRWWVIGGGGGAGVFGVFTASDAVEGYEP